MLYSPLIMELRVVAGLLEGGEEGPRWKHLTSSEDAPRSESPTPTSSAPATPTFSSTTAQNENLTCGVCLDVLYKPVGLAFGHVFCRDFLLQSAGVLAPGASFKDLRRNANQVGVEIENEATTSGEDGRGSAREGGEKRDACPECRQEHVFASSVRRVHLLTVVYSRRSPYDPLPSLSIPTQDTPRCLSTPTDAFQLTPPRRSSLSSY